MNVFETYAVFLKNYLDDNQIDYLKNKWNEKHRHFHNEEHLSSIIEQIREKFEPNYQYYDELILAAFFHDVIYDPQSHRNEVDSVDVLFEFLGQNDFTTTIADIIFDTGNRPPHRSELSKIFWQFDNNILNSHFSELLRYENKIFKEYQVYDYSKYLEKRIDFLRKAYYDFQNKDLLYLIDYLNNKEIKIGVYPGSFNPFHTGHLNILEKAEKIFDKVIIAYGLNPQKNNNITDLKSSIPKTICNRQIEFYNDLLPNFINKISGENKNITLIRGLRNEHDLSYESNQLQFIKEYDDNINVVYISCDKEYEHISSTSLKQLKDFDIELANKYLVE